MLQEGEAAQEVNAAHEGAATAQEAPAQPAAPLQPAAFFALPQEVTGKIADMLMFPVDGQWHDRNATFRTYCAVSMAGHALSGLRDALATRITEYLKDPDCKALATARTSGSRWTDAHTCDQLRAAAKVRV